MSLEQMNASRARAVTPHDTNPLTEDAMCLYIGGAGTITVITINGQTCLFSGVPAGFYLNVKIRTVKSTGTTCTNIVALS